MAHRKRKGERNINKTLHLMTNFIILFLLTTEQTKKNVMISIFARNCDYFCKFNHNFEHYHSYQKNTKHRNKFEKDTFLPYALTLIITIFFLNLVI